MGLIREKYHAELRAAFESEIYQNWDNDTSLSPPRTRPPTTTRPVDPQSLGLELIAMDNGSPLFPLEVLLGRFRSGSVEQDEVKKLQQKFEEMFPPDQNQRSRRTSSSTGANRASGQCDFSVDGGRQPVNVWQDLEISCVPIDEVPGERQGKGTDRFESMITQFLSLSLGIDRNIIGSYRKAGIS